ncbi:2-hydroxyacid dehydrogenase [Variovorax sp. KK3]|uniref:2-hydroxyacid dehydrogenase n=1 Tax=Variovorax sp. KK3 TaxID=1855728 RepID=UPI00097C29ED|nr:2-hydroxyacid dehydrogenase [Variovorax sp. KK3]
MSNTTRPRILQRGRLLPQLESALAAEFDVHLLDAEQDNTAWLAEHGHTFVALTSSARYGADRALIDALPNLRVISSFGVGYETIDVAHARERGIQIGYTPDVLNDCVADTAFGLLMDAARRFSASDRFVRRGEWLAGQYPLTTRISGKKLGILGLGRIGRVIARRASGFDMEVRYHNRRALPDAPFAYEPTLHGLARWADFLVVASAGGAETRKLVDAGVLEALGPKGFLINISRGSVVDEAALLDALREGRIAGAGLDVFEREPQVPEAFFALDNAVLLPHVASATHETRQAMADLVFENLRSFFAEGHVKVAVP